MSYSKITKFPTNKTNPFVGITLLHVEEEKRTVFITDKNTDLIIDGSTGELKGHTILATRKKVDKAEFMKIYKSSLKDILKLSRNGIAVFGYIASILKPNQDYVFFDMKECMTYTEYKHRNSILSGLSELIERKFIARGAVTNFYYINPTIFFNGNRLTLIQDYILESN